MADYDLTQGQNLPRGLKSKWRDMGDGTHALVYYADGAIKLQDENGAPYGIRQIDNRPLMSSKPFLYDIEIRTVATLAGAHVTGGFEGWLEEI